jgi:hypothetical protein
MNPSSHRPVVYQLTGAPAVPPNSNKNCIGTIIVLMLATLTAMPKVSAAEDAIINLSSGLASNYAYRGIQRADAIWQSSLYGTAAGWRGRIWLGQPLSSKQPTELQSALGHQWELENNLSVEVTGTHFWYVDPPVMGAPVHSFEGALALAWHASKVWEPAVQFAYDIRFRSRIFEASVTRRVALMPANAVLEFRAFGGHVAARDALPEISGTALRDDYLYFGIDGFIRKRIGRNWSILGEVGIFGSANQNLAWSSLSERSAVRDRFSLSTIYRF